MRKNKVLALIAAMMTVSGIASASVAINFLQTANVQSTAGISLVNPALVLLVWDKNATATFSTIYEGAIPGAGGQLADGDYVLWSGNTTKAGGFVLGSDIDLSAIYTDSNVGSQAILNGSLYAMVFSSAVPVAGSYFGARASTDTPLRDASGTPTPTANTMNFSVDTGAGRMILDSVTQYGGYTVQAVPEPSTVGLLLVGAGLVALRRMRRA